ncbi:hypothetical protein [Actinoallomurus sp. NPDC052274]|uniref:hypothetical protein n=1 Tax=Actinoallomurus sp. NPDC052274 TaxID=3155420 RepID=UPI0034495E01
MTLVPAAVGVGLIATVLAKTPGRHVGSAAGLVNTALQIGAASGVALIGTVYFGLLDGGHPPVRSAAIGLLVVTGLYLLAAPATLILPAGRSHFTAARPQRPSPQATAADPHPSGPDSHPRRYHP